MKSVREFDEIFLHRVAIDGRKGINGLACIAETSMIHSPLKGGLFVFINKRGDTIKIRLVVGSHNTLNRISTKVATYSNLRA